MKIEKTLYRIGLCIPLILLCAAICLLQFRPFLERFYMPCIFHSFTGWYCPGCGGTRAVMSLLKGAPILSFLYHPFVLYTVVIYVWFMISHTIDYLSCGKTSIGMKYRNIYLWIALAIFIINTAVKDVALTAFHTDIPRILDQWFYSL